MSECGASRFDWPPDLIHRLQNTNLSIISGCVRAVLAWITQRTGIIYRSAWIKDNLGTVQRKHHPVKWMVSVKANAHTDPAEARVEYWMASRAVGVENGLPVTARYVVLTLFPQYLALLGDYDGCVPQSITMAVITLENWRYNNYAIALGKLKTNVCSGNSWAGPEERRRF